MLLQPWRAQRGQKLCNARLGHPFSLVSGAHSAEKMLLLQLLRAQHEDNFDNAKVDHLFSLVSGARSAEKHFAFATLARAARTKIVQR